MFGLGRAVCVVAARPSVPLRK